MALFVGKLPSNFSNDELEDLFYKYGRILRCQVKRGMNYGEYAFGFVEFEDKYDAYDAIRDNDGLLNVLKTAEYATADAMNAARKAIWLGTADCLTVVIIHDLQSRMEETRATRVPRLHAKDEVPAIARALPRIDMVAIRSARLLNREAGRDIAATRRNRTLRHPDRVRPKSRGGMPKTLWFAGITKQNRHQDSIVLIIKIEYAFMPVAKQYVR
ncbi:hypothetical protein DFQ29_000398 [Apophysomyces sp. BC1021]|nr:hypothetical protein DFQ29_000398 [Apophysomyces sp. BC1021]